MKTKLMGVNLLEILAEPELAELRAEFTTREYPKGAVLFEPRSAGNLVFIITRGSARLYLAYEEKEFTLSILSPGDIYATHTRAYVQAMEDLAILCMPTDRFATILRQHPHLARTMVLVLGDILQSTFSIIHSLAFKDIPSRIAEFFCAAAREYGESLPQGHRLRLSLTTEQIAKIVGATRQTVSETLTRLEREGLVLREGRGLYVLPDIAALESFATSGTQ